MGGVRGVRLPPSSDAAVRQLTILSCAYKVEV